MNTADLSGAELDYWTARADHKRPLISSQGERHVCLVDGLPYAPSSDWRQGGPYIEREKIMLAWVNDHWIAGVCAHLEGEKGRICKGPTALIAAMRALVQAKFGDSVLD
ncbi:hypothetical protein J2W32_001460 [Variovorax boronicumulans]|uniref:DUF2591 domain-containing protein n=1 Tax=Variovorax boronicumulans TaxID=436515 RepID=A0AAW8CZT9_9BURK|nr:phage protein NinX family protein [Variovorax boronicumulans]MDP9893238.1 hypothetical protein [Variovorax boronicumulans]MDQ0052418.1 hypothetical protein [Variovorax boronicumulans]